MTKIVTTTAASQSLVSFSFNLPADVAELFTKAASCNGNTPQQHAAAAAISLLGADCEWYRLAAFNSVEQEPLAIAANAPGAEAETINVNLLATDMDEIIASQEDLLHNDCGSRDLSGLALVEAIEALTPADLADEGRPANEAVEKCHYSHINAAQLRRLLAARGAN